MSVAIPAEVQSITMKSMDALEKLYEDNLFKGFGSAILETYNYVDTVARALNGLTTNTYSDSIVVMDKSVNEALAEDEG